MVKNFALCMNSDIPGSRSHALEPLLYMCGTEYVKRRYRQNMLLMS